MTHNENGESTLKSVDKVNICFFGVFFFFLHELNLFL